MQQYNIFQAIFMSFYSKKLYRDVAFNWGGKAFLYLLMLLALSWIPATYQVQHLINQKYTTYANSTVIQVPILTFQDGKLSTPENRIYEIYYPGSQEKLAVIDTTGKITTLEQAKASMLITQTTLVTQSNPNEIKTNQFPKALNGVVKPDVINSYVKSFSGYTWILFFIFVLIGAYIYRVIQALLYALIGKFFSAINSVNLTYGQVLQIAMIAVTPAIILATITDFFSVTYPFRLLGYFILTLLYLFYGVVANKKSN